MILSYNDKVYHVSAVNVNLNDGKELHDAVFQAKEVPANTHCDLHFQIPPMLCDILIEYAKLDNPDAILVVNVKDNKFSWNVLSEAWLKHSANCQNVKSYIS
jgi:hypothetical protein